MLNKTYGLSFKLTISLTVIGLITFFSVYNFISNKIDMEYKKGINAKSNIIKQAITSTEESTGGFIDNIIKSSSLIKEISVINTKSFIKGDKNKVVNTTNSYSILYGTNNLSTLDDIKNVEKVTKTKKSTNIDITIEHVKYKKSYIFLDDNKVTMMTTDLSDILSFKKDIFVILFVMFFIFFILAYMILLQILFKNKKIIDTEKEKFKVAKEFSKIMQTIPNLLYKCKMDDSGQIYVVYNEGHTIHEINIIQKEIEGKRIEEVYVQDFLDTAIPAFKLAFEGKNADFYVNINGRILHNIVKPIGDEKTDNVIEIAGYAIDVTEQKKAEDRVQHMAYHDNLTGLPNRLYFTNYLSNAINHAKENELLAIMIIDLDNFKKVNEISGHLYGDELLIDVTNKLKKSLRKDDFFARFGGDEFIILVPNLTSYDYINAMAGRVLDELNTNFKYTDLNFSITTSIGMSVYPNDGDNATTLLKNAELAMIDAKNKGKNNYQYYSSNMNDKLVNSLKIENDLKKAIQNNELVLFYQPQVDTSKNKLIGVEALIRWNHPTRGFVSPAEFIPIAEDTDIIIDIGEWVLNKACEDYNYWKSNGIDDISVSVNLSGKQFNEKNLSKKILDIINTHNMSIPHLTLEITESTSMGNMKQTISTLQDLKSLGLSIAIDDFGTGYSSLSYLKKFPIDYLKIDRSFINDIFVSKSDEAVVKSIIDLARNLNLDVIAEGVETKEQIEFLAKVNCTKIQGFYFSKPLNTKDFEKFYSEFNKQR